MNDREHRTAAHAVLRQASAPSATSSKLLKHSVAAVLCAWTPALWAQQSDVLTPNQQATAAGLLDVCQRLASSGDGEGPAPDLTSDQSDLLTRCANVFSEAGVSQAAIDEIGAQQFNAIRTISVQFAQNQYQSVMDRLVALRTGQRGTPLASTTRPGQVLGAGASSDGADDGGLLDSRAGFWMRGTYGDGGKHSSIADRGFTSDQWGATGGFDYRLGKEMVAGISLGYGEANASFRPGAQGGFDAEALNVSVYGTAYAGGFYADGIFNYIDTDYDTSRRILFVENSPAVLDRDARASINGRTLSAGLSVGYDFVFGAFTVAPVIGYFYVDGDLDGFRERGAGGLDLLYADRDFRSSTGNIGFRAAYAWRTPIGVFVPQLRASYVREFDDDVETFKVRFANDPLNNTPLPATPIVFNGGSVDQSYYKFALGISAQFKYDVSGYVEYQRLQSFQFVDFGDLTFGLRMQRGF